MGRVFILGLVLVAGGCSKPEPGHRTTLTSAVMEFDCQVKAEESPLLKHIIKNKQRVGLTRELALELVSVVGDACMYQQLRDDPRVFKPI
jgi:hypothetical protein